jgi:hypothetical protein
MRSEKAVRDLRGERFELNLTGLCDFADFKIPAVYLSTHDYPSFLFFLFSRKS